MDFDINAYEAELEGSILDACVERTGTPHAEMRAKTDIMNKICYATRFSITELKYAFLSMRATEDMWEGIDWHGEYSDDILSEILSRAFNYIVIS